MSTSVDAVILCEDRQTEVFIRRFLLLRGWNRHRIRVCPVPSGHGSGEQWVREQFPIELAAYRRRSRAVNCCLIVAIDADTETVESHIRELDEACLAQGIPCRQREEHVALVVPKRNIETWLAYLRGEAVNEESEYRKYRYESECQVDAERLNAMCLRRGLTPEPPPSLQLACEEFARIQR